MNKEQALAVFEDYKIRRMFDETAGMWYFSIVDKGSQSVTKCNRLKMMAADGNN
jgi:hypothetical protein